MVHFTNIYHTFKTKNLNRKICNMEIIFQKFSKSQGILKRGVVLYLGQYGKLEHETHFFNSTSTKLNLKNAHQVCFTFLFNLMYISLFSTVYNAIIFCIFKLVVFLLYL